MKNSFVHPRCSLLGENKSARLLKQLLLSFLLASTVAAQNFPDAQQTLAAVRLRQSTQEVDLQGQLRQDATVIPFRLVQQQSLVRYIFTNPDETLQLRLGANDSRLEEISRQGADKISGTEFKERVRGTAITYEDLALKFLYWPNAKIVGADNIRTRNCWKMQLLPGREKSQYAGIFLWVDKESGALMRLEGFDVAGKLIKRFEVVSAQKIEGRWFLKQMRVEAIDPASGRTTARTYLEIKS